MQGVASAFGLPGIKLAVWSSLRHTDIGHCLVRARLAEVACHQIRTTGLAMIALCLAGLSYTAAIAATSTDVTRYRALSQPLDSLECVRTASNECNRGIMLQRADILASMVKRAPSWQTRSSCAARLADSLNTAILNGAKEEGLSRLSQMICDFRALDDLDTVAFLEYTQIESSFSLAVEEGVKLRFSDWLEARRHFECLNAKRMEQLADFITKYRNCPRIVNALFALANADERAERYDDAMTKYERVIRDFPVLDESGITRGHRANYISWKDD